MRAPRSATGLAAALTSIPLSALMYGLSMIVQRTVWLRSVPAARTVGIRGREERRAGGGRLRAGRSAEQSGRPGGQRGGGHGDWAMTDEMHSARDYHCLRQNGILHYDGMRTFGHHLP